jgi:hypothetical protein
MGDAIHVNVPTLAAVPGLDVIAGYVTGTPTIQWTAADFARFTQPIATIDQGATGSPATATVRDVETGAWTPAAAVDTPWNVPPGQIPTIYCNQSNLPAILGAGYQGALWIAFPGWQPGQPLPSAPGCTFVAVQNQLDVANAYDLSEVLDPTWPLESPMTVTNNPVYQQNAWRFCSKCRSLFSPSGTDTTVLSGGVCPAGGAHDGSNSYLYTLPNNFTVGAV